MQSTRPASIRFLRISPSPDWLDDIEPLASTKPATPAGARWWTMCCTQAKLALPAGGTPYCQRLSSRRQGPGLATIAVAAGVRADELHRLNEHA